MTAYTDAQIERVIAIAIDDHDERTASGALRMLAAQNPQRAEVVAEMIQSVTDIGGET